MKLLRQFIIPTFCILLYTEVNAQAPWTLQQCIDYALKHNIQIKQTQLNSDLSKENLLQSKAAVLPSLNGNISHSYNFGRTIDPFTNEFADDKVLSQNFSLSSNVILFNGFQTFNTIRQNHLTYLSSKYDVAKTTNDVSLSVATAYLQILFNEELRDAAQNQAGITAKQVERTQKLLDVGSVAKGTLLDIQAQLASEELSYTNAQNAVDISYLTLIQLLELDSVTGFTIVKPDLNIPSVNTVTSSPYQIYTGALTRQPEIKSAEYKLESSEKALSAARGGISPRLVLSGSYGTGYSGASKRFVGPLNYSYLPDGSITNVGDTVYSPIILNSREVTPFSDQVNDNLNKNIGLHLTIPLFNGLQTKTNITRAKIQLENSKLTLEATQNQLNKSIQQAYADANAAFRRYTATLKAMEAMKESFKYIDQKFAVGMVNSNDYNDAKNKLTKAQSDMLQSKYDYVFKVKVLDFYQGKPLNFN